MKIVICGSGTAGHFYPALELGEELEKRGHSVYYVANKGKIECLELRRLNKQIIFAECNNVNFKTIALLKKELKNLGVDAVVGFGGYISFCLIFSAKCLKIPAFIHEQNTIMGSANRVSQFLVKKVFTSFDKTEKATKKCLYVGNPIAEKVKRTLPSTELFDVVFVMGSLGSSSVNKILDKYLEIKERNYKVLVITGKHDFNKFKTKFYYRTDIVVLQYDRHLISHIKSCKLVVCRSGATTLCELMCCAKPSILIPSPYVKNNHQLKNAQYYSKWGASKIIEEANLTHEKLKNVIEELIKNDKQLVRMSQATKHFVKFNGTEQIINAIEYYG